MFWTANCEICLFVEGVTVIPGATVTSLAYHYQKDGITLQLSNGEVVCTIHVLAPNEYTVQYSTVLYVYLRVSKFLIVACYCKLTLAASMFDLYWHVFQAELLGMFSYLNV